MICSILIKLCLSPAIRVCVRDALVYFVSSPSLQYDTVLRTALAVPCGAQREIVGPIVALTSTPSDERTGSGVLSHYRLIDW